MSKQVVIQMLERALNDQAFAKQLKTNFDAAIKGYDLIADEIAALKKGDEGTLRAMGVDERLSKPWGVSRRDATRRQGWRARWPGYSHDGKE